MASFSFATSVMSASIRPLEANLISSIDGCGPFVTTFKPKPPDSSLSFLIFSNPTKPCSFLLDA